MDPCGTVRFRAHCLLGGAGNLFSVAVVAWVCILSRRDWTGLLTWERFRSFTSVCTEVQLAAMIKTGWLHCLGRNHSQPTAQSAIRQKLRAAWHGRMQELELKVQMEKEFANRGAKQTRAIKASDEKVVALERTLQGFVEDFEKERAHMRQQWEKASADMAAEVDGYKRLAEV